MGSFDRSLRLLLIGVALAVPSSAGAAEVHVEGDAVVYTAAPGETNNVELRRATAEEGLVFGETSESTVVTAPCTREEGLIRCPGQLTVARFDLGDGDDQLTRADDESPLLPVVVSGGAGNDVLVGTPGNDVIDAGPGDDDVPGLGGDDRITGGDGNDSLRGGDGNDFVDGGPGDDWVNGMEGADELRPGTGVRDQTAGGPGDDRLDLRNGEIDRGETASCDDGTDTIGLDEADQIIEFRQPSGGWLVEVTCEKIEGQRAMLKPSYVGLRNGSGSVGMVDLVSALPATITFEILVGKKVVRRGVARRTGARTVIKLKKVRKSKLRRGTRVKLRAMVVDSAGRRSVATFKSVVRR